MGATINDSRKVKPFGPLAGEFQKVSNHVVRVLMPQLSNTELRMLLVVMDKTIGRQKDSFSASYGELREWTGIQSDTSVRGAIKSLGEKGIILLSKGSSQWASTVYAINPDFELEVTEEATPKNGVQSKQPAPKNGVADPQKMEGRPSEPTPKNGGLPLFKDSTGGPKDIYKDRWEEGTRCTPEPTVGAVPWSSPPPPPRTNGTNGSHPATGKGELGDLAPWWSAICDVCGLNWKILSDLQRRDVLDVARVFRDDAVRPERVRGYIDYHRERYQKPGDRPSLSQFRAGWGDYASRGSPKPRREEPPPKTPEEERAELEAYRRRMAPKIEAERAKQANGAGT